MDYFEQFNKQKEINEGLFGNLFSKDKSNEQEQDLKKYGFYKKDDGSFIFGRNSIAEVVNNGAFTADAALARLDLLNKSSNLNFLVAPGTNFYAKKLNIDLTNEIVSLFVGEWKDGDFKGKRFEGVFKGSSFRGNFYGNYDDYKPNVKYGQQPYTFVGGTFYDYSGNGILGLPNTLTIGNNSFNFITVPVGNMLSFKTKHNRRGYIKVLKRLDGYDSNFSFEVLSGLAGDGPKTLNLDWEYFRNNWNSGIFEITPGSPDKPSTTKNIAGLIQISSADEITEMYITASDENPVGAITQPTSQTASQSSISQDTFDLTKIPVLGIKNLRGEKGQMIGDPSPVINIDITGDYQRTKFNEIVSNIESGEFLADLKEIKKYVSAGVVDGYGPFIFLKKIFNDNPGTEIFKFLKKSSSKKGLKEAGSGKMQKPTFAMPTQTKTTRKNPQKTTQDTAAPKYGVEASLQRLNDFMEFFVENIVTKKGEPRNSVKNIIINKLKTFLGTLAMPTPVTPNVSKTTKSGVSAKQKISGGLGKGSIQESIRLEIRSIIKNNF